MLRLIKRRFQTPLLRSNSRTMASIPADVQEFLINYPRNGDDRRLSANLGFYTNTHRCQPDNLLIEEVHEQCVLRRVEDEIFNEFLGGTVTTTSLSENTGSFSGCECGVRGAPHPLT